MVTYQYKTIILKLQELSVLRPELSKEMDIEYNKYGAQGYDIDSIQFEGDHIITIMKKEIKSRTKKCATN
jgi:hypothetical protein